MMQVFVKRNTDDRVQVDVDALEGWDGFEQLAALLCRLRAGHILARADGPDARSWVLELDGREILLHHDDVYGHFFFARNFSDNELVTRIGEQLAALEDLNCEK